MAPHFRQQLLAARAQWTLPDVIEHVNGWPVVRRLVGASSSLAWHDLARFRAALAEVWGPKRQRKEVRWPLAVRVGFAGGTPPGVLNA